MAVEDFNAAAKGLKVEIVSADHQNKADVGSQIARQWYDTDHVDLILDVPNSGVALAVNQITRDKKKAFIVSSAATSDLTGKACSPNTDPLDVRHLGAGQRHGQRRGEDGRRFLVLHHGRLRLRPRARAGRGGRGPQERGQGAGQGPAPAQHPGLLLVPAPGPGLQGQGHRPGQRRRRHHQRHQAGRRVRHRARAARTSPACSCSSPTCTRSGWRRRRGSS